jgi:hypothetical protein
MIGIETLANSTKINFRSDQRFISKHPVDFLYFNNKKSCFIYLDCARFSKKGSGDGKIYIEGTSKGNGIYSFLNKETKELEDNSIFSYKDGLNNLIKIKQSLGDIYSHTCYSCASVVATINEVEGRCLCNHCYEEQICQCHYCQKEIWRNGNDVRRIDGGYLCNNCFNEKYAECSICSTIKAKTILIHIIDLEQYVCHNCKDEVEEKFISCYKCEVSYITPPENFFEEIKEGIICKHCLKRYNDSHQLLMFF